MIEDKFIDLYARGSGLRDKLIAERDVVLTYALRSLIDTEAMRDVAFKGGTCLRKMVFGASGRFSEDLDFTLDSDRLKDDVLLGIVETFNGEHYGIRFTFDEYYMTDDDTSFGGDVLYRHAWNDAGRFRLQVSLRERPTLPVALRPLLYQAYFEYLEFEPFAVRTLEVIEMMAEKVRAVFQRVKARDVYDMYLFARMPFDGSCGAVWPCSSFGKCGSRFIPKPSSRGSIVATTIGRTCDGWCGCRSTSTPLRSWRPSGADSRCSITLPPSSKKSLRMQGAAGTIHSLPDYVARSKRGRLLACDFPA